jgi:hypothetical protein
MLDLDRSPVEDRLEVATRRTTPAGRERAPIDRRPRHRYRAVGAAAAVLLVSGAVAVATLVNRSTDLSTPASPIAPGIDAPDTATASTPTFTDARPSSDPTVITAPVSSPPAVASGDVAGIYLPTQTVAGFTLTGVDVARPFVVRPERRSAYYVRAGADGTATGAHAAMVVTTADPVPQPDQRTEGDRQGSITVHGESAHVYDSGAGIVVQWDESGFMLSVRGVGLSSDAVSAYAELSMLDPGGTLRIPGIESDGFAIAVDDIAAPPNAAEMSLSYRPDAGTPGQYLTVGSRVNSDQRTVESLEIEHATSGWSVTRADVGGLPALVASSRADDDLGQLVFVEWIRDGFVLTVTDREPAADLLAIANTLQPATLTDARALDAQVDTTLLAFPMLDRATLPNGFDTSIHTTGTGADIVCVHQPIERCEAVVNESSLGGSVQSTITGTFGIDGVRWLIGWAAGVHEPTRVAAGANVGPADASVQGSDGTFAAIAVAGDGDGLRFDPDDTGHHSASTSQTEDLLTPP